LWRERVKHFGEGKASIREPCEALDLQQAGCLLRDKSTALPMTAKLRPGIGGKGIAEREDTGYFWVLS
jgi:hypothetical protein